MKRGMTGPTVLKAQRLMAKTGYYQGTLHGSFDAGLERAITRFQQDHDIWPDGTWNYRTAFAASQISDTKKTNGERTPEKGEQHGER